MARHRDLAEGLRTYLEVAGVKRPELFTTDTTRKAITFHDLRATGLTWMAIRGDEPLRIMQRAGHESFATTQLYMREAEAIREGFGEVFPPLTPPLEPSPTGERSKIGAESRAIAATIASMCVSETLPGAGDAMTLLEPDDGSGVAALVHVRRVRGFNLWIWNRQRGDVVELATLTDRPPGA